jgi:hypothetical protein
MLGRRRSGDVPGRARLRRRSGGYVAAQARQRPALVGHDVPGVALSAPAR